VQLFCERPTLQGTGALAAKGGQKYLEKVAEEDPRTFCTLLGKVLPLQLQGDPPNPVTYQIVTGVPRTRCPRALTAPAASSSRPRSTSRNG
jgi:hypothetical protein